ncbi:MAG: TauD/TfdA dioxygenase family protein [Hyphomicrobiaceae bacterium]
MAKSVDGANDRIVVKKLHPALGAEVRGVDFSADLDAPTIAAIQAAWMENLVLVFPEQPITDAQHVCVTRCFGEPEVFHQNIIKSKRSPEIFRVANTDDDGKLMPPDHPTIRQLSGAQQWHTDSSYRETPCIGALLHGIEVSRTGGVTCFTNMYAVWDDLPETLKARVRGRRARHDFGMLARELGAREPTEAERKAMPPVWQPMVRRHPVTGRPALYISPIYNDKIEGLDDAEARRLIKELADFTSQPRYVYEHHWSPHDILMWDNRCTMHYVTPHDPMERRVMHRTTIAGDGPVIAA